MHPVHEIPVPTYHPDLGGVGTGTVIANLGRERTAGAATGRQGAYQGHFLRGAERPQRVPAAA